MSRNVWVISDTHFGHGNIIRYCDRPFHEVKEMNDFMVDRWNAVVKNGDIVYHLGDVYFPGGMGEDYWKSFFPRLKGRKRLILGNHDDAKNKVLHNNFQKIMMWRMFPEYGLLLTHVPVHESTIAGNEKRPNGLVNVHGHIHNKESPTKRHKNVSVEVINYMPVNIEELKQ